VPFRRFRPFFAVVRKNGENGRQRLRALGACLSSRILLDVGVELGFLMGHEQELSWVEDR